jgi:hypothetical protein
MSEQLSVLVDTIDNDLIETKYGFSGGYARTTKRPQAYFHILVAIRNGLSWNPKNQVIDHANRNKLDNRRSNLRIVSRSLNATNSTRSDRAKGYYWAGSTWVVKLVRDNVIYKKCFRDQNNAKAYAESIKNKQL